MTVTTPSPAVASTPLVVPALAGAAARPPAGRAVELPAGVPRVEGTVESASVAADGAIAVVWNVAAPTTEVVDALAEAITARLTLLLDDRGAGGGVLAFTGERFAGHYLVTALDGRTRVELRLDPPPFRDPGPPAAVDLPAGFPSGRIPIFPGATVVSASAVPATGGRTRFVVAFESPREPVEVLGFYRDLLSVAGWTLSARSSDLDGSGPGGSISLTVSRGARSRAVLLLDWTGSP